MSSLESPIRMSNPNEFNAMSDYEDMTEFFNGGYVSPPNNCERCGTKMYLSHGSECPCIWQSLGWALPHGKFKKLAKLFKKTEIEESDFMVGAFFFRRGGLLGNIWMASYNDDFSNLMGCLIFHPEWGSTWRPSPNSGFNFCGGGSLELEAVKSALKSQYLQFDPYVDIHFNMGEGSFTKAKQSVINRELDQEVSLNEEDNELSREWIALIGAAEESVYNKMFTDPRREFDLNDHRALRGNSNRDS